MAEHQKYHHVKISCPDGISFSEGYIQQEYQIQQIDYINLGPEYWRALN